MTRLARSMRSGILTGLLIAGLAQAQAPSPELNLMPRPVAVDLSPGVFHLSDATPIIATDAQSRRIASQFNELLLSQSGFRLRVLRKAPAGEGFISFGAADRSLPPEGYRL